MIRPEALTKDEPLRWSAGSGIEVWQMFTGNVETMRQLLETNPSLVNCHYIYRTPLYFAVRENQLAAAQFLLAQGANPIRMAVNDSLLQIAKDRGYIAMQKLLEDHLTNSLNASPIGEAIAAAIRERDLSQVQALLDANPDLLHSGDANSNQPIHWSVMTRQIEIVEELLSRGADINARRSDHACPIHLTNGDYRYRGWRDVPEDVTTSPQEMLDFLIRRGAKVDIWTAAAMGDLEMVKSLLDAEPSLVNRNSDYSSYYVGSGSPLNNAAAKGHLPIVRLLLERGADPNLPEEHIAPQGHALYSAAAKGHYEIAKLLLEHGAFPNPAVESSADALTMALTLPDKQMAELLCSYGATRSVELLAYSNDLLTAAAVFAANTDMANDPLALAVAASNGHEGFVRLMLRYHPDLAQRIAMDQYWVVGAKTREITELLFDHGMSPDHRDWLGMTALHHFAKNGDIERAALYIEHGADINAIDEDICSTPLGWAAKFGKKEMVAFLLEKGADPNLPDDLSWATPMAWATSRGHDEIVEMLVSYSKQKRPSK